MPDLIPSTDHLSIPDVEPREFKRNLIRTAVCEFRFPTLLELEHRAPEQLQKALRSHYPFYEKDHPVTLSMMQLPEFQREVRHKLESRTKSWIVSVKPSSLAIETSQYTTFEAFCDRLAEMLNAAEGLIDSDFFTRVGLRFINAIPLQTGQIEDWVNYDLVSALSLGKFGAVTHYWQEIHGRAVIGKFSFRHGILEGKPEYILDFDFFGENVEAKDAITLVTSLHRSAFSLFYWCLGPDAKVYLEAPEDKGDHRVEDSPA